MDRKGSKGDGRSPQLIFCRLRLLVGQSQKGFNAHPQQEFRTAGICLSVCLSVCLYINIQKAYLLPPPTRGCFPMYTHTHTHTHTHIHTTYTHDTHAKDWRKTGVTA